jgi:hypothetical protein
MPREYVDWPKPLKWNLNDEEAGKTYPNLRHVYDKVRIAKLYKSKIPYGDINTIPKKFPVILKPRYGCEDEVGRGSKGITIVRDLETFNELIAAVKNDKREYYWQHYSKPVHETSIDNFIKNGKVIWTFKVKLIMRKNGDLDYMETDPNYVLPASYKRWIEKSVPKTYSGPFNIQELNGFMLENHLRCDGVNLKSLNNKDLFQYILDLREGRNPVLPKIVIPHYYIMAVYVPYIENSNYSMIATSSGHVENGKITFENTRSKTASNLSKFMIRTILVRNNIVDQWYRHNSYRRSLHNNTHRFLLFRTYNFNDGLAARKDFLRAVNHNNSLNLPGSVQGYNL